MSLTDVSSTGERVHVMYPKEVPDEEAEAAGDEEFPPHVEWRRVVLDGVSGEIVGDFEELASPDTDKPGPFEGVAGDGAVFYLEGSDLLSGAMLSEEDGSEQWRTEDLFTCEGSKVHRADRPVVFSGAVVVRAGCGSLDAELIALDPEDGSVLWHLEGEEAAFLTSELRSVRGAGELLQDYEDNTVASDARDKLWVDVRNNEWPDDDRLTVKEVADDFHGAFENALGLNPDTSLADRSETG